MKENLILRPGVGIVSGNKSNFIRTPSGNYKLKCSKEKLEQIKVTISQIAQKIV